MKSPRGRATTPLLALAILALALTGPTGLEAQSAAVLLRGATVVDGTGAPGFVGDVLIERGQIVAVGPTGSVPAPESGQVEDLPGLVLAPGFIDIHNHSTDRLFGDTALTTQIAQGVTTIVVGADGNSPWPIGVGSLPPWSTCPRAAKPMRRRSALG